ncbi:DegV family protein [uncultured Clostridium sp.]|jgi:DegV family protein with EDD domain|uniref:DegV family protein n=1 Tax=uncultured Clostridium sp. TaxID=59620 RepID=UPI002617CEC9|nr:DegV family protein [uncultured Clostridium sp.]
MEKIAIITDSTCGVPDEYLKKYKNIEVMRLKIIYGKDEFVDGLDIQPSEVYERLENNEIPTTSMPSVQDAVDAMERLADEGYTHVIGMFISAGLSGTMNSFRIAANQFDDRLKSFIFDSKMISMAVGFLVMETARLVEEGMSYDNICNEIPKMKERMTMYFTVDTLEYLIKGGRVGKVSGAIGQMLNLKPIITMDDEDGKYTTASKVRGSKKALSELIKIGTEALDKGKSKVAVMTGTMQGEANKLMDAFREHKNTTFEYMGMFTPVIGVHSGPKIIAFAVMNEK